MIKLIDILNEVLEEKKKKADRCLRIARREYDKPSAYRSGAIVRCRSGNIWKDLKEDEEPNIKYVMPNFEYEGKHEATRYPEIFPNMEAWLSKAKSGYSMDIDCSINLQNTDMCHNSLETLRSQVPDRVARAEEAIASGVVELPIVLKMGDTYELLGGNTRLVALENEGLPTKVWVIDVTDQLNEDESLHKWFKRRGAKGKSSGWIDCNAPDGDGGYKPCGRQKGEERAKYPACRETPEACKDAGKGTKWGKTK